MGRRNSREKFNKRIAPLMMLMIVPLMMYAQNIVYDTDFTHPELMIYDTYLDLFNFYKSIALYIVTTLAVVFYFLFTKKKDMTLEKDRLKYYVPILIYAVLIILSTVFAIFPKVAIFGVYERFEGALVLLSYLIIIVYTIESIKNELDVKMVMKAFLAMNFIIALIGVFQSIGLDPFKTGIFQKIIGLSPEVNLISNFARSSYSTLYNPNNLGQFITLVFPVSLSLVFALKGSKWRYFAIITALLNLINIFTCNSDNAFVGLFAGCMILAILFFNNLLPSEKKKRIVFYAVITISVAIVAVVGILKFDSIINSDGIQNEIRAFDRDNDDVYLEDIKVSDNLIQFFTSKGTFNFGRTDKGLVMMDEKMTPIPFEQKKNRISFLEEPYDELIWSEITSTNSIKVFFKRNPLNIAVEIVFDREKFIGLRGTGENIFRELPENQMPEAFRGFEATFSRRGYLWFTSISRFDEVWLIGAGPDNFLYWFEQNDLIGKFNMTHRPQIIADKPHNLYIQVAVQTGVISLVIWFILIGTYAIASFKRLGVRKKTEFREYLGTGILAGIIGFMAASVFVDSSVGVGTIFYLLLAVGIYINGTFPNRKKASV